MTDCRLVMVTWMDSRQTDGAWQWLSNYEKLSPVEVVSVGWLIQDDSAVKVLAQSLAPDGGNMQVAGRKVIPTCSVQKIETLAEDERSAVKRSYRKHTNSKRARVEHTKRVKQRKKKYGGVAAFAYDSMNGRERNNAGKLK